MTTTIYDARSGPSEAEVTVVTDCLDLDSFIAEFSDALTEALTGRGRTGPAPVKSPRELCRIAMARGFKVGMKVAGYKAEDVEERRLLTCGPASFNDSMQFGSGGAVRPKV